MDRDKVRHAVEEVLRANAKFIAYLMGRAPSLEECLKEHEAILDRHCEGLSETEAIMVGRLTRDMVEHPDFSIDDLIAEFRKQRSMS